MTNDIQVVARFKGGDPVNPRFTKTASLKELMLEVMKALPVDMVYMVLPHQDGKGYSLRELGVLTADIADEIAPLESQDIIPEVARRQQDVARRQQDVAQVTHFLPEDDTTPQVDPLLAPQVAAPTVSNVEQVAKKPRKKKSAPDSLPSVTSNGGRVEVTSITPGTPEQIAAASHFKGF